MEYLETIKLAFGNNLILGHKPTKLTLDQVANKIAKQTLDVESFGFWDSSSPNYTTFYPEVTAEDLTPKDSEFIEPVFRALSEVVVHRNWNPVDFSQKGVLRKSLNLLKGQAVNADHETSIGNAMGAVSNVAWQESYTSNGIKVPAGINASLKIDGKSNPRIARGIMMDPPSIHSSSVTVMFLWEKSHSDLSEEDFFRKLGTYDDQGKLITRIATLVKKYNEISLVSHGADPFAQKIEDGKIVNPLYAGISYNSDQAVKYRKEQKLFFFNMKQDIISNNEEVTIPEKLNDTGTTENSTNNKNLPKNMNPILLAFAAAFKLTANTGETEEQFQVRVMAAITAMQSRTTELESTEVKPEEITRLKGIETQFKALGDVAALQAFQTTTLTNARNKTIALYNKVTKGKPVEAISNMIGSSDLAALDALNSQYQTQLEQLYPATCKKCGGTEISRASAKTEKEEGEEENSGPKDNADTMDSLREKARKRSLKMGHSEVK